MIHVHGTTAAGINCGINSATLNYTVKSGDRLSWKEYKQNANGGLALFFTDGANTAWAYADTDGNTLNQDANSNQWRRRTFVFPSSLVGKTLSLYQVLKDPSTGASTWDVWTSELTLYSTDGTVTPLTSVGIAATGCQGASTNLYSALETTGTAPDAAANTGTRFYLDDHLGTAQMELSSAGWPLWTGQFAPFGQELDTNPTTMRFKFTGKERDAESGLDYFGARYYASNMGRFMSPDSIANDIVLANPQTWNRYMYARNNPIEFVDPDGQAVELLGKTDEERKKALGVIQGDVSKEAGSRLYINEVKDGDNTRYFVGVNGNMGEFKGLGDSAQQLGDLVENKSIVEFGLTGRDLSKWGGAATFDKGEDGNNTNIRVLVNPQQVSDVGDVILRQTFGGVIRFAGQTSTKPAWHTKELTTGITTWHEFGHAWAGINGRGVGGGSNSEAIKFENTIRKQQYGPLGRANAPRVTH